MIRVQTQVKESEQTGQGIFIQRHPNGTLTVAATGRLVGLEEGLKTGGEVATIVGEGLGAGVGEGLGAGVGAGLGAGVAAMIGELEGVAVVGDAVGFIVGAFVG